MFFMLLRDRSRKKAGNTDQLCVHWPAPGHAGGRACQGLLKQQPAGEGTSWAWGKDSLTPWGLLEPCPVLPQVLQKPMARAASGQWSAPFVCPNGCRAQPLCAPGVWTRSWHGQCELGIVPALSPARRAQPGALGSVLSPKPLFLTFPPPFQEQTEHLLRPGLG